MAKSPSTAAIGADTTRTACPPGFRFASSNDEPPENVTGGWFGTLNGYSVEGPAGGS